MILKIPHPKLLNFDPCHVGIWPFWSLWPKYTETLLISPVKIWFQEVHPCNHRLLLLSNDYFCFYPYLKDKVSIPKPQVLAGGAPKDPKAHLGLAREEFSMLSSNFSCHAIAVDIGGNQPHPSRPKIWESWGSHSSQAADGLLPDQRGRPSHPTFGGIWVWKWATAYFFSPRSMGEMMTNQNGFRGGIFWDKPCLGKIWTIQFWCVWVSSGAMWSSNTSKKCCFCSQKHRKTIKTYSNTMGYVPGVC